MVVVGVVDFVGKGETEKKVGGGCGKWGCWMAVAVWGGVEGSCCRRCYGWYREGRNVKAVVMFVVSGVGECLDDGFGVWDGIKVVVVKVIVRAVCWLCRWVKRLQETKEEV